MSVDSKNTEAEFEEHIPMKAKLAYGFANSGHQLLSGIVFGAIDTFYLKLTGIEISDMGLSWLMFIIWNMINDPLIGIIEERTKSKLGRRVPYLRYGAGFYVIAFIIVWYPFASSAQGLMWNHLLMLFIFDTIYSMVGLVTYSMPAEMAITAKERSNIVTISALIGLVATIGTMVIPTMFLGDNPDIDGFRIAMFIIAIISGLTIYIASYFIKENKYTQLEEPLGFFESIKETFKNKPFLIIEVAIFAMVIMQNVLTGYIIFVFDYIISLDLNLFGYIAVVILLAVALGSIVFTNKKVEQIGLKKIVMMASLIAAFGFGLLLIFGSSFGITANNKMPLTYGFIPFLFIVVGLIVYMLTNQPLMADCIDNDELLTGKRRETTYSGVNALITKPAVSIGHYLFLVIIEIYGYNKDIVNPVDQPAGVAQGVLLAFTLIPMVCLIISAVAMKFYPLDGGKWKAKKQAIQKIHIEKEKKYVEFLKQQQDNTQDIPKNT